MLTVCQHESLEVPGPFLAVELFFFFVNSVPLFPQGKLLYCHPPPGIDPDGFQHQHERCPESRTVQASGPEKPKNNTKAKQIENVVDKSFFHQVNLGRDFFRSYYSSIDMLQIVVLRVKAY